MNYAQLFVNGNHILPALLADLRSARETIHVSVFLIFRDPIGEEVAAVLCERARAGVKVRVLLNVEKTALGDPFSTGEKEMMKKDPNVHHNPMKVRPLMKDLEAAGVEVCDTDIDYDHVPANVSPRLASVSKQIREGAALDILHVDHRKIIVIDGRVAWCGGANIGAQYMFHHAFDPDLDAFEEQKQLVARSHPEPWWKWHDSLTRFEGPVAAEIDEHFRDRWLLDGGSDMPHTKPREPSEKPRGRPVREARVLYNEPNEQPNQVREAYLRLIREARREIFITNPYLYHPDIAQALVDAKKARPSLEMTLIVPARAHNDNLFGADAQEYNYLAWLDAGIHVYEYQNHFTHLKMAVFDRRWSIHGSTNLNYRSLENDKDFELVVLVDDEDFAQEVLEQTRDEDVKHSVRIERGALFGTFEAWRKRVRDPRTLLLMSRRML